MIAKRATLLWTALVLLALALAAAFACSQASSKGDDAPVVDTEIMAFLSEARALHHEANLKEDGGDLAGAIAAIDRLVAARKPHPDRVTPEVEEVLADAYARLAELRLKRGDLDPARAAIQTGLTHSPDATYFKGHLLEVDGLVEEARAARLADAGNAAEAQRARERAIALLEEVVRIQDQVIQRSLAARDAGR
jgi:tetratricopeptide (TPR) repeat protein